MSAETLRRAAALVRERAEGASAGPWEALALGSEGCAVLAERPAESKLRSRLRVARLGWEEWDTDKANAEHIASWHPAVALAVADWLDDHAETAEMFISKAIPASAWSMNWQTSHNHALAVARAYLGEQP